MSVVAIGDRRSERYAATRREILDAAWDIVRADGLGAISMRDLGARVGMRAQSLYGYFPSKEAIFDAMFAESNEELLRLVEALPALPDPLDWMRSLAKMFLQFCVEDSGRYQLLFQRPIPNFEPSAEALAPALQGLALVRAGLRDCGITDERAFDAWTAVTGGLAAQQNANEPGGNRWVRLVDDVIDMYIAHYRPHTPRTTP